MDPEKEVLSLSYKSQITTKMYGFQGASLRVNKWINYALGVVKR